MAVLVVLVLVSIFFGGSDATWCVCRSEMNPAALQKAIDYACGAGADCGPISQNGACYQPNTELAHCSYAANSYYQRRGQAVGTCDFAGTATITSVDPSYTGCTFPSSAGAAGTGNTPTTPGSTTPGTPNLTPTNNNGVLGFGPSPSTTTDGSGAGVHHLDTRIRALSILVTMLFGLVLLGPSSW